MTVSPAEIHFMSLASVDLQGPLIKEGIQMASEPTKRRPTSYVIRNTRGGSKLGGDAAGHLLGRLEPQTLPTPGAGEGAGLWEPRGCWRSAPRPAAPGDSLEVSQHETRS